MAFQKQFPLCDDDPQTDYPVCHVHLTNEESSLHARAVVPAVVQHRMKQEYGVDTILEPLTGYNTARWAEGGWEGVDAATVSHFAHS